MITRQLVTLMGLVTVAHADPSATTVSRGYVGLGADVSLGPFTVINQAVTLDGGYRIASSPWFVHATAALGGAGDEGNGRVDQLAAGIEYRRCIAKPLCVSDGIDVGYVENANNPDYQQTRRGPLVRDRMTIDAGGNDMRVWFGVELGVAHAVGCSDADCGPMQLFGGANRQTTFATGGVQLGALVRL